MSYIGKIPATQGKDAGPALKLDDISSGFNGLTTVFDLEVDGTAVDPHINNISVYLSGVYQIPASSYSLSGSQIVFTAAPSSSLDFHGAILGATRIISPDNNSVEPASLTSDTKTTISGSYEGGGSTKISGSSTSTGSFGHIYVGGNITASGTVRADSFESVTGGTGISFTDDLNITGNITASGEISSSVGNFTTVDIDGGSITGITDLAVADGGTGASTFTDGGVLLGSGTSAITAMSALGDSEMIVGDGSTDPVAESGATLRTSIGVGTTDDVKFANITGSTVSASSAEFTSDLTVSGNITGSNNISASGDLSATGNLDIDGTSNLASDLYVGGNITGSNNISASGDLTSNDITASGDFLVKGDANVAEYIYHQGDNDTFLRLAPNLVNLSAGGKSAIKYEASAGKIIINNTNEDVDFHVMAEDNSELLATDAANNRLGINTTTPTKALPLQVT